MAASGGLLAVTSRTRHGAVGLAMAAVVVLLTALLGGERLDRTLVDRRWRNVAPGYELIAQVESKYQNLALGRRAEQYSLYCDGHVSVDFPDPYTFVPQAHFWMCQHPWPRRVLMLGGGAEGLLAEILKHPVEQVDYVEPDPRQIALVEPYLAEADRQALTDERVTVQHTDARYYVKTQANRFDLVIARLAEPTSALRARLYTDEFYGELRRAMTPRSVLCLTAAATPGSLTVASADYLASIQVTLTRHFPEVTVGWGNPAQVLAATQAELVSTDGAELARRYVQRGVASRLFHPAWFDGATDWLETGKLAQRAAQLDAARGAQISTDLRPAVYMQRLALWEKMIRGPSGGGGRVIEWLRSVKLSELIVVLAACAGVTMLLCYLRQRGRREPGLDDSDSPAGVIGPAESWASKGAIVLSVGSTGLATMALSIVWLFAFQNLYGYVYQRIGWIIAVFMGGLVLGCGLVGWRLKRLADAPGRGSYLWRWLIAVDVLLAVLAGAVPFVLPALGRVPAGPWAFALVEVCVSVMVLATGVLGGAAFPLAGELQLGSTGRAGAAAGSVVGADHAGACLGALLSGLLLVPVFGIAAAALLLCGLKLASAAILALVGRGAGPARYHTSRSPE
jgi:spermidine synthase